MKPIYGQFAAALALTATLAIGLAGCVPQAPQPTPAPSPTPVATTPPPVAPPPAPNWIDRPQTVGNWQYGDQGTTSSASFVAGRGAAEFAIICNRSARQVQLSMAATSPAAQPMVIRTESTSRTLPTANGRGTIYATVSANDPLLDAMAITRGRFGVEAEGVQSLYLPPWAEVTKVIEDCR